MKGTQGTIIYLVVMIGIFYFLLIRPQQQKQKQHQRLVGDLKVNDPVVTAGGIMGTIIKMKDKSVILKAIDNNKFEVLKSHISYVNEEARSDEGKEE